MFFAMPMVLLGSTQISVHVRTRYYALLRARIPYEACSPADFASSYIKPFLRIYVAAT